MKHRILLISGFLGAAFVGCPGSLVAQSAPPSQKTASLSLEQRVKAIEDREAILKTMHAYAYTIDFGREVHEYTDLYTEDAVFDSVPSPAPRGASEWGPVARGRAPVVGREALEKWIVNEWQMREKLMSAGHYRIHEMNEPDITIDGDRAMVHSYFQTTDNDNGRIYIVSIGVYQDQFVRSPDGRWRIKERVLLRQGGAARNPAATSAEKGPSAVQP
jgi:ketosteroid isomerase-like protein